MDMENYKTLYLHSKNLNIRLDDGTLQSNKIDNDVSINGYSDLL